MNRLFIYLAVTSEFTLTYYTSICNNREYVDQFKVELQ